MRLSLIAACSRNRVIGINNQLPWNLPEDLKRFRQITSGHAVIMGRKTYESIGRLLPNRLNVVVTRRKDFQVPGAEVVHSLEEAIEVCRTRNPADEEIFVIGGGDLYRQAMDRADRIYLTLVETEMVGDAFFPEVDRDRFRETANELRPADDRHAFAYRFLVFDRV